MINVTVTQNIIAVTMGTDPSTRGTVIDANISANDSSILASIDASGNAITSVVGVQGPPGAPGIDGTTPPDSTYTNATPSVIPLGGIAQGTTFDSKTVTEMFDALLYPELFPSLSGASVSFSSSQTGLKEVGAVLSSITFSLSLNRGSISPAYGTSGYRVGLPTAYAYTGTGISGVTTNTAILANYTVVVGSQSWSGSITYAAGEQPLSSKGNNYGSPAPGGTASGGSQSITGVYPFYATTVDISTRTKQALTLHTSSYFSATVVAESGGSKQAAEFPQAFNAIVGVQFFNTVSSSWEWIGGSKANSLAVFTKTASDVSGVPYWLYTHNSSNIGSRQLRFYTV